MNISYLATTQILILSVKERKGFINQLYIQLGKEGTLNNASRKKEAK